MHSLFALIRQLWDVNYTLLGEWGHGAGVVVTTGVVHLSPQRTLRQRRSWLSVTVYLKCHLRFFRCYFARIVTVGTSWARHGTCP
jgi:hypothetical protein